MTSIDNLPINGRRFHDFIQATPTVLVEPQRNQLSFVGLVPNAEVFSLFRTADVVAVPSHAEYTEGFPLTMFEAVLSGRTDWPDVLKMFRTSLTASTT